MNPETDNKIVWHYGINFVVACLLFVALVAIVKFSVTMPAINADRATIRAKALADIRAAEATALATPGWIDQDRNIVRRQPPGQRRQRRQLGDAGRAPCRPQVDQHRLAP